MPLPFPDRLNYSCTIKGVREWVEREKQPRKGIVRLKMERTFVEIDCSRFVLVCTGIEVDRQSLQ